MADSPKTRAKRTTRALQLDTPVTNTTTRYIPFSPSVTRATHSSIMKFKPIISLLPPPTPETSFDSPSPKDILRKRFAGQPSSLRLSTDLMTPPSTPTVETSRLTATAEIDIDSSVNLSGSSEGDVSSNECLVDSSFDNAVIESCNHHAKMSGELERIAKPLLDSLDSLAREEEQIVLGNVVSKLEELRLANENLKEKLREADDREKLMSDTNHQLEKKLDTSENEVKVKEKCVRALYRGVVTLNKKIEGMDALEKEHKESLLDLQRRNKELNEENDGLEGEVNTLREAMFVLEEVIKTRVRAPMSTADAAVQCCEPGASTTVESIAPPTGLPTPPSTPSTALIYLPVDEPFSHIEHPPTPPTEETSFIHQFISSFSDKTLNLLQEFFIEKRQIDNRRIHSAVVNKEMIRRMENEREELLFQVKSIRQSLRESLPTEPDEMDKEARVLKKELSGLSEELLTLQLREVQSSSSSPNPIATSTSGEGLYRIVNYLIERREDELKRVPLRDTPRKKSLSASSSSSSSSRRSPTFSPSKTKILPSPTSLLPSKSMLWIAQGETSLQQQQKPRDSTEKKSDYPAIARENSESHLAEVQLSESAMRRNRRLKTKWNVNVYERAIGGVREGES
jgi:maltodextrin utilization protein YvdJ